MSLALSFAAGTAGAQVAPPAAYDGLQSIEIPTPTGR
jgi:hypothetical protein